MKGIIIAIISLLLIFLVFLPILHMGGKISLKEYYEGITNWVPEKTPESYTFRNLEKVQEDLRVAPKAERLLILGRKVQSGQKLSDAEMVEAENLRKEIEQIRRVDQKWSDVGKKLEPIGRLLQTDPKLTEGPQVRENLDGSVTIFLPANVSWYDTGVDLDGSYTIQAQGDINFGMPRTNGPAGYQGMIATWGESPMLGAPNGALIGRIGNGQPFLIGAYMEGKRSGRLFLTINDGPRDLGDNRGSFKVTVW